MTIFFPDISHYQSGLSLMGAVACLAKATQGSTYTDPSYASFKAQADSRGILFGAYHWLDSTDAAAQARHCFSVVGATPLMIDDEQSRIDVGHTLAFVSAYRALGGRVVLEYAPQWVWSASGRPSLAPLASVGLFIVSSSYPGIGYTATGSGWNSYGGITPAIWQYTDKQPFNGRPVDFNAYRGTLADLRNLLYGAAPPAFTRPEEDDDMHRIRSGATDGSIYLAPGYAAPSGKMAAYGLLGATNAAYEAAGVKLVQLPKDMTVAASGLYDLSPQPWPAGGGGSAGPSPAEIATAVNDDAAARLKD